MTDRLDELMHTHWLTFASTGEVSGCHCGFRADPDDEGYGDGVVRHLLTVGLTQ